jgi:regulator of protease activity HflC (stomatin/prohibitin superfamily)
MVDKIVVSFLADEVVGGFFVSVPPGHVATVYDWGRGVLRQTWGPGLHFKLPFWQKAKLFNLQTLEYTIKPNVNIDSNSEILGDLPINAITADNQTISVHGSLLFRLDRNSVVDIWERIGEDFVSKIVRPVSRSRVRSSISRFNMVDLINRRHDVEAEIKDQLVKEFESKGIIVEGILLSDVVKS